MTVTGTGPTLGAIATGADALNAVTWGSDYTATGGTLQPVRRQIQRGPSASWRSIAAQEIIPNGLQVRFREVAFDENAIGDAFYTEFVTATGADLTPLELRSSVTDPHTGMTYNFVADDGVTPEVRQVGQHFLGDWFVIATPENPVRIGSITPVFQRGIGTIRRWRGKAVEGDLWINGAMLNPSRLARDENFSPNWGQGFSSYTYSATLNTPGRLDVNVDPGYTGAPLVLSGDGDVLVKSRCYWLSYPPTAEEMGGPNDNIGTITLSYSCLTVRHNVPRARSLRPACAPSMKFATLDTAVDDIDLSKFTQLDQSAINPPTFKSAADRMQQISSYTFAWHDDNSRNIRASGDVGPDFALPAGYVPNEKGYDRDEHRRFGEAFCTSLRAPTTGDDSAEERLRLIGAIVQYSLDATADIYAGADRTISGAGYGMGWASVVTVAHLALGYQWIATLRNIPVPNPATGTTAPYYGAHPLGNFPARPEFGQRSYGCVEDNRFTLLPAEYVGYPIMQVENTKGRAYPLAFQDADVGRPVWIIMDSRFFLGSSARIFRGSIDPRMSYHDMQGAMHAPIIGVYLMPGGRAAYNNDVPLLTIDRIRWLHNAGLTKTGELGFSGYTARFASEFRNNVTTPPLWAGMPERPRAPTVDGYTGDPSIIRVTPYPTLMTYGHAVTRHDLRYTTTQPSTTDYNEPIWTTLNDVTFDPYYDITGLDFPPETMIYVQHQYWTSQGRSGWSPSHRATSKWLMNPDGTRNRLLGPYEDPEGSQGTVLTSAHAELVNTIPPRIVGSPSIGSELLFERGEWSVVPWNWSQISWRLNGVEVATGDTWRVTQQVSVGDQVTVAWTTSNSSSQQSGVTDPVTIRAAETFEVPVTASVMTLTNTSNPNDRTRWLYGASDGSHPARRLAMMAMATSTGGDALSQIMRLKNASGVNVDAGVNNELVHFRQQQGYGSRVASIRWYEVASASAGGVNMAYWSDPFRDVLSGMSAFYLGSRWDLSNAWTDGDRAVTEVDPDDPETPLELVATIRDYRQKPRIVPEGSLILSAVVFGRSENLSDELPVWSDNVSVMPGMERLGLVSATASVRHMVSVAAGIQAVTGPCDVSVATPQADTFYAFSVLVIPPM